MRKIILLFCLLLNSFLFSQESEGGRPFFFDYRHSGINSADIYIDDTYINSTEILNKLATITKSLDNEQELRNVDEYQKKYAKTNYLSFYGKKIDIKKNFKTEATKFRIQDKLIYLLKIKSENAYSLQAFFSKFNLPDTAKFFVYNLNGMILGSFSNRNVITSNESENVFVTQPIEGNEIYLELDIENEDDLADVNIEINTIMHGFLNLYASDGPYSSSEASTYTSCNRNVSCIEGNLILNQNYNNTVNKGNIKSVGLIVNTNAIYGFTCSGTLINNTKQDGTPYFLTAEHCVNGSAQSPIFLNESVVIFNHETKACTATGSTVSGGITSPSTNSVAGMQVLVAAGIIKTNNYPDAYSTTSQDFALVKLNTNPATLQKYKVCYSGWSTLQSPSNIAYSFTAHHPMGTVKKISVSNGPYITPTEFGVIYPGFSSQLPNTYYSKSYSNNLTAGYFLAAEFGDGFPYHGSSGASLFTKEGFILGTLSSGPEKQINSYITDYLTQNIAFKACATDRSDKAKYNVLFSRFWRDYIYMQPWLNPDSQNVQSVGNYCPAGVGTWGSINIENPQEDCIQFLIKNVVSTPDNLQETIKDVNQYRVKPFSTYGKKIYVKTEFTPEVPYDFNEPKMSNKLLCLGLDRTCQSYYYLNHSYRITNNSVKKILPKDILMTNQLNINGEIPPITAKIINADDDRVAVLMRQRKLVSSTDYNKLEIDIYKYNESSNEYITESIINIFENALELQQTFPNYETESIKTFFEKNIIVILIPYSYQTKLGMIKIHRQNESSPWIKTFFPVIYQTGFNQYIHSNTGYFFKKDLLILQGSLGTLAFNVKSGTAESPALLFVRNTQASILGVVNMSYQGDNIYELFGKKQEDKINVWRFNMSTSALDNYSNINLSNNLLYKRFFVNTNMMLVAENTINYLNPNIGIRNKRTLYYKEGNQWLLAGTNYTSPIKSATFGSEVIGLNDNYFLDDIEWKYLFGTANTASSNNSKTQLYPAYNILNSEHLKDIFQESSSGAYMILDNLEREEWLKEQQGNTKIYDNFITQPQNTLKVITSDTNEGIGTSIATGVVKVDYKNPKTYILSGYTNPLIGNKKVKLQAPFSIVMKPGFEISANSGADLHALVTSALSYPESLTYDDMLHPILSGYQDKADKKMAVEAKGIYKDNELYGDLILLKESSEKESLKQINVYPNPTDGFLFIKGTQNKVIFEIFNVVGQKVQNGDLIENKIDVRNLNKGMYILSLQTNNKTEVFKFIKK